jgi:hypothetical protein
VLRAKERTLTPPPSYVFTFRLTIESIQELGGASPPFVPLDPNLYPTYSTKTKELDPKMFRNYTCYVSRYVYLVPKQPIVPLTYTPHSIGNQFLTMVQLVTNRDRRHIQ